MKKRFKEHFDFVRTEIHGFKLFKVHYKGTKSTYPFGWKKKKPEVIQQDLIDQIPTPGKPVIIPPKSGQREAVDSEPGASY